MSLFTAIAIIIVAFALPLASGFVLARLRPAMPGFTAGLWSMLPLLIAFLAYAGVLAATTRDQAPSAYALPALLVFGTVAALLGFGLGFFGHMLGRRR